VTAEHLGAVKENTSWKKERKNFAQRLSLRRGRLIQIGKEFSQDRKKTSRGVLCHKKGSSKANDEWATQTEKLKNVRRQGWDRGGGGGSARKERPVAGKKDGRLTYRGRHGR